MAEILVLGAGAMGTAFCFPLADAGNRVCLVGTHLDKDWVEDIRTKGVHPKLKKRLPVGVTAFNHNQLSEVLSSDIRLIVLGVSSAGVSWVIKQLGPLIKSPTPILMLTKGLTVKDDLLCILPEIVQEEFNRCGIENPMVGAVGGPCIAAELAARRNSSVIFAHPSKRHLDWLQGLAKTEYYHIRTSTDVVGVEVCAALKNFYALAIGSPAGWLQSQERETDYAQAHNLSSGLFTQALEEMRRIVRFMGGSAESVYGLPGCGDLYVTCQAGRNSRMGRLLGQGLKYSEAKARHMPHDTIEGAELALNIGPAMEKLMEHGHIDRSSLPLGQAILEAVCRDQPLRFSWEKFYNGTERFRP